MAEAQLALGQKKMVKEVVDRFDKIKDELSPEDREIMSRLRLGLGKDTGD
jgi:hypothetical protein